MLVVLFTEMPILLDVFQLPDHGVPYFFSEARLDDVVHGLVQEVIDLAGSGAIQEICFLAELDAIYIVG